MINKVILTGRLTANPESRALPSGVSVAVFTIAVNRKYKDKSGNWQEESFFFDIESFGQLAERLSKQLAKGYQVLVEGQLRQDRWEKDGEKRSKIKIVAERVSLVSKPSGNANTNATEEIIEETIDDVPW